MKEDEYNQVRQVELTTQQIIDCLAMTMATIAEHGKYLRQIENDEDKADEYAHVSESVERLTKISGAFQDALSSVINNWSL